MVSPHIYDWILMTSSVKQFIFDSMLYSLKNLKVKEVNSAFTVDDYGNSSIYRKPETQAQ